LNYVKQMTVIKS